MTARVLFFVALLVGSVSAQFNRESTIRRIRVRVVSASGSGCDASTHITLMGRSGPAVAGSPDSDCEVEFYNIPVGTYHLTVSRLNIITFETDSMAIDAAGPTEVEVKIDHPGSSVTAGTVPASPLVGVAELNIPSSARKEFDKANQLVGKITPKPFSDSIRRSQFIPLTRGPTTIWRRSMIVWEMAHRSEMLYGRRSALTIALHPPT